MVILLQRFTPAALVLLALAAGCSVAPIVPVQATNRNVLAEVVFVDTT